MKRRFSSIFTSIISVLILSIFLNGCTGSADKNILEFDGPQALTVYYIDNYDQIKRAMEDFEHSNPDITLNKVAFDSAEELQLKIASNVSGDEKADVFLLRAGYVDVDKIIASGALESLNDYFEADESFNDADYYESVLECGNYKGERYVVPIGFCLNSLYTTKQKLNNYNNSYSENPSYTEIIDTVAGDLQEREVDDTIVIPRQYSDYGFNYIYKAAGIDFVNVEEKSINFDNDEFRKIADFSKEMYKESKKVENTSININQKSSIDAASKFAYFGIRNITPIMFMYYQTLCNGYWGNSDNNVIEAITLPIYDDNTKYCAIVDVFGAMSSSSENKAAAYKLLKSAMSTPGYLSSDEVGSILDSSISANKAVSTVIIDSALSNNGYDYMNISGVKVPFAKLTKRDADYIKNVYSNIGKAVIPNYYVDNIFSEVMKKYYEDEMSFEDCISELENKLNIYMNE